MISPSLCNRLLRNQPFLHITGGYAWAVPVSGEHNCSNRLIYTSAPEFCRHLPLRDHYRVLGIARDASPREIRNAYLSAAKEKHPDTLGKESCSRQFLDVKEAYEVLSDQERRLRYDSLTYEPPTHTYARHSSSPLYWDAKTSQFVNEETDASYNESKKEMEEDVPYTTAEYLTFAYCFAVSVFVIFVLFLYY
ncbi:uncharacterized protein [Watersipora subatra]|uniref:uncharacterized protein isoform X2 n=1 Tax=Watersipora subatra TaxID=2589382 RepID=UPI00355B332A